MAKENPDTKPKTTKEPTPFERFDALARKVIRVPKDRIREQDKKG